MKPDVRKLLILNLPYLIFVYLFGKVGQAYRLGLTCRGSSYTLRTAFQRPLQIPSPACIRLTCASVSPVR